VNLKAERNGRGTRVCPATIARRIYAISSLCKYLTNYGYAEGNPCGQVVLPKKARRMPAALTMEEARRVMKVADDHACPWMGFRNRAIVAVLVFCGLGGRSSLT
jgi:site-specific recombinase XerD